MATDDVAVPAQKVVEGTTLESTTSESTTSEPTPRDEAADEAAFEAAFSQEEFEDPGEKPAAGTSDEGTTAEGTQAAGTSDEGTTAEGTQAAGSSDEGTTAEGTQVADTSGEGTTAEGTSDEALTLEQKAHGYDSMVGRLNKERERAKALEQRLSLVSPPAAPAAPSRPAVEQQHKEIDPATLSPETMEGVREFVGKYPKYAAMVKQDSPAGDQLRSLIETWSPDIAAIQADNIMLRADMTGAVQAVDGRVQQQTAVSHNERILAESPDLARVATVSGNQIAPIAGKEAEYRDFFAGFNSWLGDQPYKVASQYKQVLSPEGGGTARQVAEVFKIFNEQTHKSGVPAPHLEPDPELKRAMVAAAAVPSRSAKVRPEASTVQGFDAGWDTAPEE